MYAPEPKKILILNILDVLRKYSDEGHRLSQKDIIDYLEKDYGKRPDRKAVKRNLADLVESGVPLEYSEAMRKNKNGEEEIICYDWYLEREFSDAEIRLLIDSILFSVHTPYKQKRELIKKLEGLSSRNFHSHMSHIATIQDTAPENKQLFYTIEVLDEAISAKKQVVFHYNNYGKDKKLHLRLDDEGMPREYLINPYQIAAAQGKYYLICNMDKFDSIGHYRLDRITDIRMLDTKVKPMREVKGLENGLDLQKHMAENVYMFTGPGIPITFRAEKHLVSELIDWFGEYITFTDEDEKYVTARVTATEGAMRRWAMQYALYVKVLSPQSLADAMKEDLKKATENYGLEAQ